MASTLCKFHIALVVLGVSVIWFEPSDGELDCKLLSAILSNYKFLSTIFGFKNEKIPDSKPTELKVDDLKREIPIQDSKLTVLEDYAKREIPIRDCKPTVLKDDSKEELLKKDSKPTVLKNDTKEEISNQEFYSLVGIKEDITVLEITFKKSPNFLTQIKELRGKYSHMRNVAKDGNCFFRSFAFGYFEYLLNHSEQIKNFQTLVRNIQDELFNWFDGNNVEELHKIFEEVITVTESGNSESLYNIFNQSSYSDNVVQYLRFITSREMRKNEDFYLNFISDDFTFDKFCREQVETMDTESDYIHIIALSTALKIKVQVASIDDSSSSGIMMHEFPDENRPCCVHLLHSPGHYSILYSIIDETCN